MRLTRATGAVLATVALAGMLQLVAVLGAAPALACSCAPMTDEEYVESADVIFSGKLIDRKEPVPLTSSMDPATLTFEVSDVYKGQVGRMAQVRTANSGASCGLEIEGEGPFLVFTEFDDNGGLTASLCGGTREMPEQPPAALGDGRPPAGSGQAAQYEPTSDIDDSGTPMAVWLTGGAAVALVALLSYRVLRQKPD
ncbi:MAG: hypothetical protein GEV04_00190 [Actinophytocola sp.]|nr:hypothetical protein [Actinophytocola sp.]